MKNANIKIVGIVILVFAIGLVFYGLFPETNIRVMTIKDQMEVSAVGAVLPEGFPEKIPVRVDGIQESFSSFYEDTGMYRYLVSYITSENRTLLYNEYITFLEENDFTILKQEENPIYIYAQSNDGDIEIRIIEENGDVLVTINYTKI